MSRLMDELYESAKGLHASGVIDDQGMLDIETRWRLRKVPRYTGEQVKEIRTRLNLSQSFLASITGTTENMVRAWEEGKRKPGGPYCLILYLINKKGLNALI